MSTSARSTTTDAASDLDAVYVPWHGIDLDDAVRLRRSCRRG
jgi:hypothetical protein